MTNLFNEADYQAQLERKKSYLKTLFADFEMPELEVYESSRTRYRMRAEFRMWHEGDDLFYAMFHPGDKKTPIRIDDLPMVSEPISKLMSPLLEMIKGNEELARKLFQVDFLSTTTGEMLVSMLYHRPIGDGWSIEAKKLERDLGISLIGRSRKNKIVLDKDYVIETLPLAGKTYYYQQVENSFTQPNAQIAVKMVEWARESIGKQEDDLLELYCGNGNFSIALADQFRQVLATEVSKSSVKSAQFNIQKNEVENLKIIRLSSEEFTQAINKVRDFHRLKDIDLDAYAFSTVLVDPPRAGLDADTVEMISQFKQILYISCNPLTLRDNLEALSKTHRVSRAALFDQFPYTEHIEAGVWLQRR